MIRRVLAIRFYIIIIMMIFTMNLFADPILDDEGNLTNPYRYSVYGIVNDDRVNVRDSLGLSSNVIMHLNSDDPITIIKVDTTPVQIGDWYNYWLQIDYMGKKGWIFGEFVSTITTDEYDNITDLGYVPEPIVFEEGWERYQIVELFDEYALYKTHGYLDDLYNEKIISFSKYRYNGEDVYLFGADSPKSSINAILRLVDENTIELEYIQKHYDSSEMPEEPFYFKDLGFIEKDENRFYGKTIFERK